MDFSDAIGRKFEIFASLTEAQALDASFVSEHPAAMCFCKDTHSIVFGGVVVSPDSAEAKLKTIYQADMLTVMDGLTTAGEWMAKAQAVQGSYLVMYDSTKSCGVVEMFMDAMGHGLTQVYTTTGTLTDGVFDSGHEDGVVRKYVRHFGVMSSGNYDPGVWTDWELVWSSEDKATYEAMADFVKPGELAEVVVDVATQAKRLTISTDGTAAVVWDEGASRVFVKDVNGKYYSSWAVESGVTDVPSMGDAVAKGRQWAYFDTANNRCRLFVANGVRLYESSRVTLAQ